MGMEMGEEEGDGGKREERLKLQILKLMINPKVYVYVYFSFF